MMDISKNLAVSVHKVSYWMTKNNIPKRSISDAVYLKKHPNGNPFSFKNPLSTEEIKLLGLGLGLYWGEGNKLNKSAVRLGNTDPKLIRVFIKFLVKLFNINKDDLRFSLQIFTDINPDKAIKFWIKQLNIKREQFYKPIITKSNSLGTYRKKSKYGVMTVNYLNSRLRNLLIKMLSDRV